MICHRVMWLDTQAFQARLFHGRFGYAQFGESPDFLVDHSQIFLKVALGTYRAI